MDTLRTKEMLNFALSPVPKGGKNAPSKYSLKGDHFDKTL